MFLKNYTSDVPVSRTIARIEETLIKCGVMDITKEYSPTGDVAAVIFTIKMGDDKPVSIRLPADKDSAHKALWLDYVDGEELSSDGKKITEWPSRKRRTHQSFREQAERTAWKLMQDWVEIQLSLIQMKQADVVQVFLPYVWDARTHQTFYQALKANGFRGMLPEKCEA